MHSIIKIVFSYFVFIFFMVGNSLSVETIEEFPAHPQSNYLVPDIWHNIMLHLPIKERLSLRCCSQETSSSFSSMPYLLHMCDIKKNLGHLLQGYPKIFQNNPDIIVNPSTLKSILAQFFNLSFQIDNFLLIPKINWNDSILYGLLHQLNNNILISTKPLLDHFMRNFPLRGPSEMEKHLTYLQNRIHHNSHHHPPLWRRIVQDPVFLMGTSALCVYLCLSYFQPNSYSTYKHNQTTCTIRFINNTKGSYVQRFYCYDREAESLIINSTEEIMSYLYENLKCNVTAIGEFLQQKYISHSDWRRYALKDLVVTEKLSLNDNSQELKVWWIQKGWYSGHFQGSVLDFYQYPLQYRDLLSTSHVDIQLELHQCRYLGVLFMNVFSVMYFVFSVFYALWM